MATHPPFDGRLQGPPSSVIDRCARSMPPSGDTTSGRAHVATALIDAEKPSAPYTRKRPDGAPRQFVAIGGHAGFAITDFVDRGRKSRASSRLSTPRSTLPVSLGRQLLRAPSASATDRTLRCGCGGAKPHSPRRPTARPEILGQGADVRAAPATAPSRAVWPPRRNRGGQIVDHDLALGSIHRLAAMRLPIQRPRLAP